MGNISHVNRRLLPLALIGLAATVAVLACLGTIGGEPTYVGSDACLEQCHKEQVTGWGETLHGLDFTNWDYHGTQVNKLLEGGGNETTGIVGSCAACHVVGWNEADKGGFDPAQAWNSSHNLPLVGIGCENCHGPGSDHASGEDGAEVLDTSIWAWAGACAETEAGCHGGTRQYGNEVVVGYGSSAHFSGVPAFVEGRLDCAHCMESKTFAMEVGEWSLTELPEDTIWNITCMACHDPHPEEEIMYQLRAPAEEICELCHYNTHPLEDMHVTHPTTEFRHGINGYDVPVTTFMDEVSCPECHMWQSPRGTPEEEYHVSHSWEFVPQACVECHSMYTNETAMEWVEGIQEEIHEMIEEVTPLWDDAAMARDWAMGNGTMSEAVETTFLEAVWNLEYAEAEGSGGAHNPLYAERLIESAKGKFMEVIDALAIAGIGGNVAYNDSEVIVGAMIKDGVGITVATTNDTGNFFFWGMPGAVNYAVYFNGSIVGTLMGTAVAHTNTTFGEVTVMKEAPPVVVDPPVVDDDDDDEHLLYTLSMALIAIVFLLVVVLVVMMMKK